MALIDAEKDHKDQDASGIEQTERAQEDALHHGHLSVEELEIEKLLRRKIDLRIMPLLILIYLMNYIDR